jgi:uncharacterized protein (DUF1501 family)
MQLNRRDFLRTGGLTALALGLNAFSPNIFKRRILAGPPEGTKKLVFIFQRGGNDGVNTLIPRGDSEYNIANRPTLYIKPEDGIDLGNGFAQLHPSMAPLMEVYNNTALNGVAGPGNLAILHRIGYNNQSQSHFDGQQYWENGTPGQPYLNEGMIYRQIAQTMNPTVNHLAGVSISSGQLVAMRGSIPLVTVSNVQNFSFGKYNGQPARLAKFLGQMPTAPVGPDGKGILGAYGGPRDFSGQTYRELVHGTGVALADAMQTIQEAVALGTYTPENGAVYPSGYGDKLKQVAMLLKRTPVRVLGVNLGGWDTHENQGGLTGGQPNLLNSLALGFQALYRDLQSQWNDLVIVTMTEFGRTSKENGSKGTDHAFGCVLFVAGGGVKGGVYNCDAAKWPTGPTGAMFSQSGRYVKHLTDYRAVFGEIFTKHFGDDMTTLNQVIPGYTQAATARPADFSFLNFL